MSVITGRARRPSETAPFIEGYLLERQIGSGGMATVYRATQLSLGQPVAVKVLADGYRAQPDFVARFKREADLQARLQHPNVLPVLEAGEADGVPYIIMRYVEGYSMRELVRVGELSAGAAAELLTHIASALDYAHARAILHSDVKPDNVLVEGHRHAWLADFGLTRMLEESLGLTSSGLVGTYDYLAPEIALGKPASAASDIYSLAVTAYQALTRVLPFPVALSAASVLAHASAPRPRASQSRYDLPPALDAVLQRGMALDPQERQPTAGALADDVRAALGMACTAR